MERQPIPGMAVHLNSIGYFPERRKRATVAGPFAAGQAFSVNDKSGREVFSGRLLAAPRHKEADYDVFHADFSDLKTEGLYTVKISGSSLESPRFRIDARPYDDTLSTVMLGFYGQRCGVPVSLNHRGVTYSKGACHRDDGYLDYYDPSRVGEKKDGTGGWHDAGDYGKYTVNAGFSMGMLLGAWEQFGAALEHLHLPIPESGGLLPDYLAELKFNLDWMLTMQFPDGRVSHKLTRTAFAPMIMPSKDTEKRYYAPWGSDATAAFAATFAQASRVFRSYDTRYADICLNASILAMNVLKNTHQAVRPDLDAFSTGRYLRHVHSDHEWAMLEYWETTGDPGLMRYIEFGLEHENYLVDVDWDWGQSRNMGIYTFLRSKRDRKPDLVAELEYDMLAAADRVVSNYREHPFGRGLRRCYWGCNGGIARTAMNLMTAFGISGNEEYRECSLAQLAYLFGNNPYGRSFVTGEGHNPPRFPHHRPSVDDGIEDPWPGHLVGGANPGELDWHDVTGDARTNENAINWDAALVYALAAFYNPGS